LKQLEKQRRQKLLKEKKEAEKAALVVAPADASKQVPTMNVDAFMLAVANRDGKAWDALMQFMGFFERHHYRHFGTPDIKRLNEFAFCVSAAMLREDFLPTPAQAGKLVQMGHLMQALFASSCYRNTNTLLDCVIPMSGNVPKILTLMNPRCEIQIDQAKLFDADPILSSVWYMSYLLGLSSPTGLIQKNMYRHLHNMDYRWIPTSHVMSGLYFSCTYHNPDSVRRVKSIINRGIKSRGNAPAIINTPDPKSIAIVTSRWHRNHAVYKSASPLVEQLVGKYRLTLVWTAPKANMPKTAVTSYFDKVVNAHFLQNGELVLPPEVVNNDFQMVYFPDIGMSDESIWMSNMRMAPIQAVGYGHPDTTGDGNEIDYFIGGDVEKDATDAYSETMVLLPGLAQEPAWPTAERKHNYKDDGIVRVNCVWGPDKYNFSLLKVLEEINKRTREINPESKHEIHLFGSPGMNRHAALPPFIREVTQLLPNAVVHAEQEYYDYMENAEMHDFSLNSFPFGCYNVLIESLYLGLPFLTVVGSRFYSRAGMYLNQQIGMEENNFDDANGMIDKAVKLITDPIELRRQRDRLASIDLKERLFTLKGNHFLEAVEYIIANHPFKQTKIIGANQ
jgi:hypothetical protein